MEVNMNGFYDSITKKNTKPPFDIPLTAIITLLPLSALAMLISVIFLMNCNRRFLAFVSDLSNSTTYAYQHESLTAMADGCSYKISGKNMYGIYAYIAMSKSGRESKTTPDGEPVVLSYGDGSTLKLWDLPVKHPFKQIFAIYFNFSQSLFITNHHNPPYTATSPFLPM